MSPGSRLHAVYFDCVRASSGFFRQEGQWLYILAMKCLLWFAAILSIGAYAQELPLRIVVRPQPSYIERTEELTTSQLRFHRGEYFHRKMDPSCNRGICL